MNKALSEGCIPTAGSPSLTASHDGRRRRKRAEVRQARGCTTATAAGAPTAAPRTPRAWRVTTRTPRRSSYARFSSSSGPFCTCHRRPPPPSQQGGTCLRRGLLQSVSRPMEGEHEVSSRSDSCACWRKRGPATMETHRCPAVCLPAELLSGRMPANSQLMSQYRVQVSVLQGPRNLSNRVSGALSQDGSISEQLP